MLIGYMRPSHDDPTCEIQRKELTEYGCSHLFFEEHSSPKKRSQLKEALQTLQANDTLVVSRLSSLADSSRHLVELIDTIDGKAAFIFSLKEAIDTSKQAGYSFQAIVKHLVAFQSDLISEKTKQGLSEAKQKGVTAGRPRKPDKNVQRAIEMYETKNYTLAQIKEATGISKSTLYRYLES